MASRDPRAFTVPENGTFAHEPPAPRRPDGPPVASLSSALGGEDRASAVDLTTLMTALPTDDELASPDNVAPPRQSLAGLEHHRQSPSRRGAFSSHGAGMTTHQNARGASTNQQTTQNQHSNVYVKNLAEDVDETALKAAFEKFGAVESCCVIRDVSTNASRGFGFVKFQTVREAKSAIAAMHGAHVRGRALEVKFANADSTPGGTGPGANGVGTVSDNVYVKGLPPRWSERELREFFKAFGVIVECRLLHASGTTTAGALIRFATVEQAISAVVHANNVVPTPGGVPLVMRFADSHGKSSRRSGKDSASNSRGGSVSGGSGVEGFETGFGALMAQHNAQHNAAMNAAMLQHQLMQQQMVSAGASLGASLGSSLGAMSASGSQHGGERAMRAVALSSPNAHGMRRRESFQGVIDEGSAHDGSLGGTFDGTHGSFNGLLSGSNGVSGVSAGFEMMSPPMGGAGAGAGGWLGPSSPFGGSPAIASARGANGGLGGLSAMFAGGADASSSAGGSRPSDPPRPGGSVVFGSSLQKSTDSNVRRAASGGSLGARSHGSANSLGSRGSSVRGGNAFGPGSVLGASIGNAANAPRAVSAASSETSPYAQIVSPVGSFDGGGMWARSPTLGGENAFGPGVAGKAFGSVDVSLDRAETPGISAEAARDILDRLETPELEKSPNPEPEHLEAAPEARRTLLVRGAPGASPTAAELYLYRAFAPHGAVVSVRSTSSTSSASGVAEHVVEFKFAAEADAAKRALDGGALGALRVTALDADASSAPA